MSDVPGEPTALYRVFGEADLLLYIGIGDDFGRRWKQHARVQPWWEEKRRQTVEWHPSRELAEAAETAAIKSEKPRYNKRDAVPPPARVREIAAPPVPWERPPRRRREWGDSPPFPFSLPLVMIEARAAAMKIVPDLKIDPETPEGRAAAGAFYAAGWLAYGRIWSMVRRALEDLQMAEHLLAQRSDAADWEPRIRRLRAFYIEMVSNPCPTCHGVPPAGMRCMACGAADPSFSGRPSVRLTGKPAA